MCLHYVRCVLCVWVLDVIGELYVLGVSQIFDLCLCRLCFDDKLQPLFGSIIGYVYA